MDSRLRIWNSSPNMKAPPHNKLVTEFGPSMGTTHNAIPIRLERGEAIDVVIMAAPALDDLIKTGKIRKESRVDLVRSKIGMAVKAGAPRPDISTIEALKRTLLAAKSIAYSDSASGRLSFHRVVSQGSESPTRSRARAERSRLTL